MKTKTFCLGDVLSITTGRLVSPTHMDGIYDILNFMTGDSLFTHALPRASDVCKPHLLKQFPQLAEIDASSVNTENWEQWMKDQVEKYGDKFEVHALGDDDFEKKDPLQELHEMIPDKDIYVVGLGGSKEEETPSFTIPDIGENRN